MANKYKFLNNISGIKVAEDFDLTQSTTIKLKSTGTLISAQNTQSLSECVKELTKHNVKYTILGLGANTLLKENEINPIVKLNFSDGEKLKSIGNYHFHQGDILLQKLTSIAIRDNLSGWESFTGVPGTLGGAICMNAGTSLGEIGSIVKRIQVVDKEGNVFEQEIKNNDFKYRGNNFLKEGDIITGAWLDHSKKDQSIPKIIKDYIDYRKKTQPLGVKTCGCLFKNIPTIYSMKQNCRAGLYLDRAGLKGFRFKNLRLSPLHANFLENIGGATYSDVINFIKILESELLFTYGHSFEIEARI